MDWWERLNDENTPLSTYGYLARSWTFCAVGESRRRRPSVVVTIDNGIPEDVKLKRLGVKFHGAVVANNRPRAKQLFLMIQRRLVNLMAASL